MEFVRQENSMGCFVACVAMITGRSYAEAKEAVLPGKKRHWIRPEKATKTLKKLGVRLVRVRNPKDFDRMKKRAVVFVRWEDSPTQLHAVIWDAEGKRVLDPEPSEYTPKSCLERQAEAAYYFEYSPPVAKAA